MTEQDVINHIRAELRAEAERLRERLAEIEEALNNLRDHEAGLHLGIRRQLSCLACE